jgi:hypothetical protein
MSPLPNRVQLLNPPAEELKLAGAILSRTYRYRLWRSWGDGPRLGWIMLNPSQADAQGDDPTLRRCVGFAQSWGYGGLEVVNLFAYRASRPGVLRQVADPIGPQNDRYLRELPDRVAAIVCAWGNGGALGGRDRVVRERLADYPALYCLGRTRSGHPRHPLYCPRNQPLIALEAGI